MDPPSLRELELETLLRERDSQVAELTDEVNQLRKYLTVQPAPSRSDPFSLPPALLSILQSYIPSQTPRDAQGTTSSTMTAALAQRTRILQEENDELYSLLRTSETGQLKEEVRSLKKTINRLDQALKDSHGAVSSLSEELDKSYTAFLNHQQQRKSMIDSDRHEFRSPPPRALSLSIRAESPSLSHNGDVKPPPTGPRAHKKPRLSEPRASPARSSLNLPLSNSNSTPLGVSAAARSSRRDRSPRSGDDRRSPMKEARMEGDEDVKKGRDRSRDRPREKDKERDRQRERERPRDHRDRDRDREPDRHREQGGREKEKDRAPHDRSRRNGRGPGGGGSGSVRKAGRGNAGQDDRTLRERMGL
ncbi:hypothetical protein ACEPAF_6444 [Sanghuangporus sanghuang]|uniref:Uncharacterized protein n=1 Tax=Sanghuangporus baumii TaxID=108892 RepID=A0A9Q5HZE1_SANBA|nr:hypothetical protein A7U60_g3936 [Sanghuangporus baumii]